MPQPPRWTLIVMRAWVDTGGMRVRMLGTDSGGGRAEIVVATPEEAARVVRSWLHTLTADLPGGTGGDGRGPT